MADGGQEAGLGLACREGILVFDLQSDPVFHQGRVALDKSPGEFEDKTQHKKHGKEVQPDFRVERGACNHHIADRDIEDRRDVDRQPKPQHIQKLVVVHRRENRGGNQQEKRQKVTIPHTLLDRDRNAEHRNRRRT